jgi:LmbE family N-acetylglucosaminyl deacetylase
MAERILVVAAHPDDELLGVGGTLARHGATGDEVHILILAEGFTSRTAMRNASGSAAEIAALMDAARGAARVVGAREPRFAGFPDNRMDEVALLDVVKCVEQSLAELRPSIVYTHYAGDLNIDHRIACQSVVTACRPLPGASVRAIYAFETLSSTEWAAPLEPVFAPNRFVDIGAYLDVKLRALDFYRGEMRAFPHPRSREAVTALAHDRGASIGVEAAEAFMVLRETVF